MILSATLLVCLLAVTADGSAIKGRQELGETKRGPLAPVELRRNYQLAAPVQQQQQQQKSYSLPVEQRELSKATEERHEEAPAQKLESVQQQLEQREELHQVKQEELLPAAVKAPAGFFEAKPQVTREKLHAKPLLASTKTEERRQEQLPVQEQARLEDLREEHEERRAELSKASKAELPRREEQSVQVQLPEETSKLDEEHQQQREEVAEKPLRHEQAKGQALLEPLPLAKGQKSEPKREEAKRPVALKTEEQTRQQYEEQSVRYEQQQQVVDLKHDYEQRRFEDHHQAQQLIRYDDDQPQQQQQITQVREEQRVESSVKGGGAAFAEAEPYAFDYSIEGSSRRESGDIHGVVRGQYTLLNGDGSQRVVDYVADRDGFRATVNTGELGTENQQPASVLLRSSQPAAKDISLHLDRKTIARPDDSFHGAVDKTETRLLFGVPQSTLTHEPIKSAAVQQRDFVEEPLKLETLTRQEPLSQETLREELPKQEQRPEQAAKKSDLQARAPKALASIAELKSPVIQARGSFESATAHGPIVHSPAAHPVGLQPVVLLPAHSHHRVAPLADHLHRSPAALVGGTRQHQAPSSHHLHVASPVRNYQQRHPAQPTYDRFSARPIAAQSQPISPRAPFYAENSEEWSI